MSSIYPDETDMSFTGIVDRLLDFAERPGDPVGGVARTMLEAVAREMAIFYATLDRAYDAGFIDTATGPALDRVVAILGIRRARAGRLTGKVEFSRTVPTEHDIVIPAGHRVTGVLAKQRLPLFETVEEVTIARGQTSVLVEVQEVLEAGAPSAPPLLNPGVLTIMPRPLLGVERVGNVEPIRQRQADEVDDQLRVRARSVLGENQRGSSEGIAAALREQGIAAEVRDDDDDLAPGVIRVVIHDSDYAEDPELQARVAQIIRTTKPAGIRAEIASQRTVHLEIQVELELADSRIDERRRARIITELTGALVKAGAAYSAGTPVRSQKLTAGVIAHPEIAALHNASITLRDLDPSGRPQLPGGDVYLYELEAPALVAEDVTIIWYRRPVLGVELVARFSGTTEATLAAVREVVKQYNAYLSSKGATAGKLFEDLRARLSAREIELRAVTALRDSISITEKHDGPSGELALRPGEILQIEDLEVIK